MLMPRHDILSVQANGMSPRRAATIGTVAAIHALAIYALISGMGTTVVTQVEHVLNVDVVDTQIPTKVTPLPLQPNLVKPTDPTVTVPEPKIDVASDQPTNQITVAPTPTNTTPPVNTVASGLTNTHSTPPYPVAARTDGHQGIVTLQITVGPNGDVANATVAQSSGFPELDQAAVEWVTNHWKYKPAVQGGVPVTSTTQAAVKFDLQQARR